MKKYLVGGYYDYRIFEGKEIESKRLFGKDIDIYILDNVIEWYNDTKENNEPEWEDLSYSRKVELILGCTECNETSGVVEFDTLEEAEKYVKDTLKEIEEIENEYEFDRQIQDECGNFRKVYTLKKDI